MFALLCWPLFEFFEPQPPNDRPTAANTNVTHPVRCISDILKYSAYYHSCPEATSPNLMVCALDAIIEQPILMTGNYGRVGDTNGGVIGCG
jgi:hypothetical protein